MQPFCADTCTHSVPIFILSSDLLNRLSNYVYKRKPFHIDDAYIGLAMRDFGVNITKISSFALRHDMNTFIHNAKDCEILRLDAIGPRINQICL